MAFWGWIPILTRKVHFEYLINIMKQDGLVDLNEDELELVRYILKNEEYICYKREDKEDKQLEKFNVIICVKEHKIEHVLMFDSENNIKAHARCLIYDDGIVEIKLDSDTAPVSDRIKPRVAKRIYIVIRDVYHSHTHHEPYDDLKLYPVLAENKKDAIEKLLNQYELKIITYHKAIKIDIKTYNDFPEAIKLITSAKGEMKYASRFVALVKEHIDDLDSYISVFSNGFESISVLSDEIELKFNNNMSRLLNWLTFVIVFVTLPITFDAINTLLKDIKLDKLLFEKELYGLNFSLTVTELIAVIYFVLSILLIYRLRYWIFQEIKRFFTTHSES